MEGAAPQRFLPTIEEEDKQGDEVSASLCDGGSSMFLLRKVGIPEPIARHACHRSSKPAAVDERAGDGSGGKFGKRRMQGGPTEWQARYWGQGDLQEKDKGRRGREVRISTCRLRVLIGTTIHPPQRQRESRYVW